MDLLEQYKQQNPEAFREKKKPQAADDYGREYSTMVRLIMRLSGGKIKDARRANSVLLGGVAIVAIIALTIFFWPSGAQNTLPDNFNKIDQSQYVVPK